MPQALIDGFQTFLERNRQAANAARAARYDLRHVKKWTCALHSKPTIFSITCKAMCAYREAREMERRLREDQEREYQAALRADEERVCLPHVAQK